MAAEQVNFGEGSTASGVDAGAALFRRKAGDKVERTCSLKASCKSSHGSSYDLLMKASNG